MQPSHLIGMSDVLLSLSLSLSVSHFNGSSLPERQYHADKNLTKSDSYISATFPRKILLLDDFPQALCLLVKIRVQSGKFRET